MISKCYLKTLFTSSSSLAFASDNNTNDGEGGTKLTINADNVDGGDDLEYTPSPSVQMCAYTSSTRFAIATQNSKCDADNGLTFGVLQRFSGYFQKAKVDDAGADFTSNKPSSADDLGSGWTYMGAS